MTQIERESTRQDERIKKAEKRVVEQLQREMRNAAMLQSASLGRGIRAVINLIEGIHTLVYSYNLKMSLQ